MNRHSLAYPWYEYVALHWYTGILGVFPLQPLASISKLGVALLTWLAATIDLVVM